MPGYCSTLFSFSSSPDCSLPSNFDNLVSLDISCRRLNALQLCLYSEWLNRLTLRQWHCQGRENWQWRRLLWFLESRRCLPRNSLLRIALFAYKLKVIPEDNEAKRMLAQSPKVSDDGDGQVIPKMC